MDRVNILHFIIILIVKISLAHPLLNLNTDEKVAYEVIEASSGSRFIPVGIKPFSLQVAVPAVDEPGYLQTYINMLSTPGFFLKPVNSVELNVLYSQEEFSFLDNMSGRILKQGFNAYTFLDGYISLGRKLVAYYQLKYRQVGGEGESELHRAYAKLRFSRFSIQAGNDSVHIGPGEYSLILSSHSEPFPMVKFQTEEPINILGEWNFVFLRGWLFEKRKDRDNPSLMALRVVWKPAYFLELGGTRASLFGGEGRPDYRLDEYLKVFSGVEENIPFSRYDTDAYGAWDITIYLPVRKLIPTAKVLKVYYQEAGTDLLAFWQKEDQGEFPLPFGFRLLHRGYITGAMLGLKKDIIRVEMERTGRAWYVHHLYPVEGYTYRGLSLGLPFGRNAQHIFLKHRHYFTKKVSFQYTIGGLRRPAIDEKPYMDRVYITLSGEARIKNFIISAFVRGDQTQNYSSLKDVNNYTVERGNKTFFSFGLSLSWRI